MQPNNAFVFKSHEWDREEVKATFNYQIKYKNEVLDFTETLWFSLSNLADNPPKQLLNNILDNLHIVLGISYYKLFCPENIILNDITFSKDQAEFWNILYTKGLGEFFYKNKIDFRGLIDFPYSEKISNFPVSFPRKDRTLLGIGGGKDSIVAGELLKSMDRNFSGFVVNVNPIMEQTIRLLEVNSVIVKREFDPLLFELNNRPDAYNGHVPVSAQNAFIGTLTALLFDYKYIVMANEESANYGNVKYFDQEVNHQFSKSIEFEQLFQKYIKNYITPDILYFSLLRPFSEIKIAEIFAKYPKYFPQFSSCNKNFRINNKQNKKWCGECPKCAFTYLMLSAYLPKKTLTNIFGQDLFARDDMLQTYKELLGVTEIKPFDCVGTPDEVKVAFYLAMQNKEYDKDSIMEYFKQNILLSLPDINKIKEKVFKSSEKHGIPEGFQKALNI